MDFLDEARSLATMAVPGRTTPDEQRKIFDAMPVDELAALWCSLQYCGIRDHTDETWAGTAYFDHLPHEQPERALALALAVLRSEAHKSVKMELNTKLMLVLVGNHGERLIDQIEKDACNNHALRWLLGGCCWWGADGEVKERLTAVADEEGWRADQAAHDTPAHRIDFAALTVPDLARAWVEQKCKPHKDQDDNWAVLSDYERELQDNDPDRLIDLIVEILKIEKDPRVLSYLAAGPLEDVISDRSIGRIEREAAGSEEFRDLLRGVWYWNESDDIKRRLDAITGLNYASRPSR